MIGRHTEREREVTPLVQSQKLPPSMASSSDQAHVVEDRCKSLVSKIAPPMPCVRTMFSVTFEVHHWVRETKLHGSGDPVEAIWRTTNAMTAGYRGGFLAPGGTTRISYSLMELEVPLNFHQPIIDQIRRAAVSLLTGDMYVRRPTLYSMTVTINRLTHRVVPHREVSEGGEVDGEDREGEEVPVAKSAVEAKDQEKPDMGGGGGEVKAGEEGPEAKLALKELIIGGGGDISSDDDDDIVMAFSVGSFSNLKYDPDRGLKPIRDGTCDVDFPESTGDPDAFRVLHSGSEEPPYPKLPGSGSSLEEEEAD